MEELGEHCLYGLCAAGCRLEVGIITSTNVVWDHVIMVLVTWSVYLKLNGA